MERNNYTLENPSLRINTSLSEWASKIDREKDEFTGNIFTLREEENIDMLDAIKLLTIYELLPISDWIGYMPKFMQDKFEKDFEGMPELGSTVYFLDELIEENFGEGARYPNITFEQAIWDVWDAITDQETIGCLYVR